MKASRLALGLVLIALALGGCGTSGPEFLESYQSQDVGCFKVARAEIVPGKDGEQASLDLTLEFRFKDEFKDTKFSSVNILKNRALQLKHDCSFAVCATYMDKDKHPVSQSCWEWNGRSLGNDYLTWNGRKTLPKGTQYVKLSAGE